MYEFRIVTDMMNRKVRIPKNPQRIVSLVPSQTELLHHLGLSEKVVGQTLFCIHPEHMFKLKERIGGTKKLNLEKIRQLNPDLIIGNKEENEKNQIEELTKDFPVWMSDVNNYSQALEMILQIGVITQTSKEAQKTVLEISTAFKKLKLVQPALKTLYLIWQKPYMAAGKNTFIDSLLQKIGLENVLEPHVGRYPEISENEIKSAELILLSSEPFPFNTEHIEALKMINPKAAIHLVDGEMFSWYGSRMLLAPDYLNNICKHFLI